MDDEVVAEHADEAAFLWALRGRAVDAVDFSLQDLANLDERIEAHLDGLLLAGDAGWRACDAVLDQGAAGQAFTTSVLAVMTGRSERVDRIRSVGARDLSLGRAVVSGLAWPSFEAVRPQLEEWRRSGDCSVLALALAAYLAHRRDPGTLVIRAISDSDPRLRTLGLRAAGELGRVDLVPLLLRHAAEPEPSCAFYAMWSAARLGTRSAAVTAALCRVAEMGGEFAQRALHVVLPLLPDAAVSRLLERLRAQPATRRSAVVGIGVVGDPVRVPMLIDAMSDPALARAAGEAFRTITGTDLVGHRLATQSSPAWVQGEADDDPSGDGIVDQDDGLCWPEPDRVRQWWVAHQSRFRPGTRYLRGQQVAQATLLDTLAVGTQRQRASAALLLALAEPTRSLFEVRAPASRQIAALARRQP